MKKIFSLILVSTISLVFVGCTKEITTDKNIGQIQFDGIYQCTTVHHSKSTGKLYSHFIRFYEDNTLIVTPSEDNVAKIFDWFKREDIDIPRSEYSTKNNTITFSVAHSAGNVDYDGVFQEDLLSLEIYSHINENKSSETYKFLNNININ